MKLLLPSEGLYGQRHVDLKSPTFGILHNIQNHNSDDFYKKVEYVKEVSNAEFNKITVYDMDYIFDVATFASLFNSAKFDVECPACGKKYNVIVSLGDCDIKQLHLTRIDNPKVYRIKLNKYSFRILSAQDVIDAYDYAQYRDNEEQAFHLAKVNLIMNQPLDSPYSKELPLSLAAAATAFQEINYHGLVKTIKTCCPYCKEEQTISWELSPKSLEFKDEEIMSRFCSISDMVSFRDFMNMSLSEFSAIVSVLNKNMK